MADTENRDPYAILGVPKSATDAEIKKAYRALARKLHPDIAPGNAASEARFKAVSAAYGLLADPERRRRYDAGEIDASGAEMPERPFFRDSAGKAGQDRYGSEADYGDLGDVFARAFGQRAGGMRFRGGDVLLEVRIGFLEAASGTRARVATPGGQMLDLTIPPGTEDGATLQFAGHGEPGVGGGPPGDALVRIRVAPHPVFRRDGDDIHLDLPISLDEAVLGGTVDVPTINGRVNLRIPPGSGSGRILRLRSKGIAAPGRAPGDQLVTLAVAVPPQPDAALRAAIEDWRRTGVPDPRANWKGMG